MSAAIRGLTLANGCANGDRGGVILNDGTLTLTDSLVETNVTGEHGGGIYNALGGVSTLSDSSVVSNEAVSGAGVYNEGTLRLNGATTSRNIAEMDGGGIFVFSLETITGDTSGVTENVPDNISGFEAD